MAIKVRQSLFWKVALYYGGLIVLLLLLVGIVQPVWLKYLPVGGLEGLSYGAALQGEDFLLGQAMVSSQPQAFFDNALKLLSAMIGLLVATIPLRWVYMAKGLGKSIDPDIASGLLALPLVVTAIVFCIKYSLPLAFALVGILAGLRVKAEMSSRADSYFIFASIGVGLGIGAGYLAIALVLAAFFSLTILVVTPVSTGYRTEI